MTMFANVTRRTFLRILFFSGVFGPIRGADFVKPDNYHSPDLLPWKLAHFFLHKESAKVVGLEYLRVVPMEADVQFLADLICSLKEKTRAEFAHADAQKLRVLLLRQQRQDFERGRIVNVHGWILSRTEARLCALAALV
jgi:hypothetical protein